jgi:hypothetical protein
LHLDSRTFTKECNAKKARILNMLDSKAPIMISAERKSYQLPAIDAQGDRRMQARLEGVRGVRII